MPLGSAADHNDNGGMVYVGSGPLEISSVVRVARGHAGVALTGEALSALRAGREVVVAMSNDPEPHYGVSTGFGALATVTIPPSRRRDLQLSLIRSHAAGTGRPVDDEVVRGMMLLRLRNLATGHTGVREVTAEALANLINSGIVPYVAEYGSLGCSGDLAPLAAVALTLTGEGYVLDKERAKVAAREVLRAAGVGVVSLVEKEGLALINGTDGMLAMLSLAVHDLHALLDVADISAAMTVEALFGSVSVFEDDVQRLRPHPGQAASAARIRRALRGSSLLEQNNESSSVRVQDAYSLRCAPAVHGAARDVVGYAESVAGIELSSAIDNPVVFHDGRVVSNGNFHGAPLGMAMDFLAIAVADVASISERRTDRLLDPARSFGLPPFLAHEVGVDSGYMIAQYTQAGIVAELKRLAVPASVDSIPTSAMQEDHVSFGWSAGLKLRRAIDGLRRVLAIELLVASRALDLRAPLVPGPTAAAVRAELRKRVPDVGRDQHMSPQIDQVVDLLEPQNVAAILDLAVLCA